MDDEEDEDNIENPIAKLIIEWITDDKEEIFFIKRMEKKDILNLNFIK